MMRIVFTAALVCLVGAAGCSSSHRRTEVTATSETGTYESAPGRPFNTECPIMHQPVNPGFTAVYKGRTVGFCCEVCVNQWNRMSDRERDEKLRSIGA